MMDVDRIHKLLDIVRMIASVAPNLTGIRSACLDELREIDANPYGALPQAPTSVEAIPEQPALPFNPSPDT